MPLHRTAIPWLSVFALVLQFSLSSCCDGSTNLRKKFGNFHNINYLEHHSTRPGRQSAQQTTNYNIEGEKPLIKAVTQSVCFYGEIARYSAALVAQNNVPKSQVEWYLKNNPYTYYFCTKQLSSVCQAAVFGSNNIVCDSNYPYRTITGVCNNLNNIFAGSADIPFKRFLPPDYEDGVNAPRGYKRATNPLPNVRAVSREMVANPPTGTALTSVLLMQWAQFLDHDLTFTPESANISYSGTRPKVVPLTCCETGTNASPTHVDCLPIDVSGDVFYQQFNIICLRFVRSLPVTNDGCLLDVREQVNLLTSFVDASQVYGSSYEEESSIRTFNSGSLVVHTNSEDQTCPNLLIPKLFFLPEFTKDNGAMQFFAGDVRVIEQPGLTSIHALFVRLHNDLAKKFKQKYTTATDANIYEETRRIVGAIVQTITYGEFLPIVLGSSIMNAHGLNLLTTGQTQNYNPSVNPATPNVFGAAAFRFGHSLIPNVFTLPTTNVLLEQSFNNNDLTKVPGKQPSDFLEGMSLQKSELQDRILVQALTNKLFAQSPFQFGSDLYSRNLQRGRDHGIPAYNKWRQFCGLSTFSSFSSLSTAMPSDAVTALQNAYTSVGVQEIDLFPAGLSEKPLTPGDGILGPTFACILGKHFRDIKTGDRFWFESVQQPYPFTLAQLTAIKKVKLSTLICRYTSTLAVPPKAMLSTSTPNNAPLACANYPTDTAIHKLTLLW